MLAASVAALAASSASDADASPSTSKVVLTPLATVTAEVAVTDAGLAVRITFPPISGALNLTVATPFTKFTAVVDPNGDAALALDAANAATDAANNAYDEAQNATQAASDALASVTALAAQVKTLIASVKKLTAAVAKLKK